VIAAPLPDPVVNGKTVKRRNIVFAGVQFKDLDGNERGGIAALDDGSMMFGIDDEVGRERHTFTTYPSGDPAFTFRVKTKKRLCRCWSLQGVATPN
jgi:hypothetical protein